MESDLSFELKGNRSRSNEEFSRSHKDVLCVQVKFWEGINCEFRRQLDI